jgi:hypothetical protein
MVAGAQVATGEDAGGNPAWALWAKSTTWTGLVRE